MTIPLTRGRRFVALTAAAVVATSLTVPGAAFGASAAPATASAVDPAVFADPTIDYRPGVRWWWPGNAASEADLIEQLDYLAENGFGMVEIVAFSQSYLAEDGSSGSIYAAESGYDTEALLDYESPEFFAKLDAVVAHANELGITVDLNIGSGYLANDDSIDLADSQSTLALGRATVRVDEAGAVELVSGDITTPEGSGAVELGIPAAEPSPFFASEMYGYDFGEWDPDLVDLNAVMLAPIADEGAPLHNANQTLTGDFSGVNTYDAQTVLDLDAAQLAYPLEGDTTFGVDTTDLAAGDYEVVALYSAATGAYGLNSIIENASGDRNYVVDHLNPSAITNLVNGWIGESDLEGIVSSNDVRAAFNDSYEFYTDMNYNDLVQAAAESTELLGYDITPYIPTLYSIYGDSFLIQGTPTVKAEYAELGLEIPQVSPFGGGSTPLLASDLSEAEAARITYDYGQLLNAQFLAGMEAFSSALGEYGIDYRQQAYNPPVDTLQSAEFVDIPETEGLDEYSIKQVTSGAHLYGKNLITSEVFTLGSVPFQITPEFMKQGYDLMATSGVNNFFYHGLSATYYGNTDPSFTSDDNLFAEEGWRAWPTIGVEMANTAGIAAYYGAMNDYAARANYVMQLGSSSSDVAIYMPLFGSLASGGGFNGEPATPLTAISTANANGWAWDAINDDTIQTGLTWNGSQLIANGGHATFDALIVESDTVPVETMEALQRLQDGGAPIVFVGSAPSQQPSFAGGDFAAADATVAEIASTMGAPLDAASLVSTLDPVIAAPISYAENEDIRFARRTVETGGELAYVRNTSSEHATTVDLQVASEFAQCWWLDPETGNIHDATVTDGVVTAALDPAGAAILLCEPAGVGFADGATTPGVPLALDTTDRAVVPELSDFTLEVTADNVGSALPHDEQTVTLEGDVFGDWSSDEFADGQLKYVTDSGTYRTEVEIPDASDLVENGAVLSLGEVHDAATVRVNPGTDHEFETQLFSAPYEVDIAPALVDGTNVIEIDVQPVQNNRREGLKELYLSDPVAYVQYQAYESQHGGDELMPAGIIGPVELTSADESVAEPGATPTPTATPTPGPSATEPGATDGATPPETGGPDAGGPDASGDDLATTGVDTGLLATLAALGLGLVAAGTALALRRRAHDSE
jgi:hypothetical protein